MKNIDINVWDFIEMYYPNYDSCDEIAYNDDLYKLITNSFEIGDSSYNLLMNEYNGEINNPQIRLDFIISNEKIYCSAIENFITIHNK